MERFGRLDLLVNNAGRPSAATSSRLSDADWADGFGLKFFGAMRCSRAAWPHLQASRGTIVNIIGIGGRTGTAEFAIGGAVNAALHESDQGARRPRREGRRARERDQPGRDQDRPSDHAAQELRRRAQSGSGERRAGDGPVRSASRASASPRRSRALVAFLASPQAPSVRAPSSMPTADRPGRCSARRTFSSCAVITTCKSSQSSARGIVVVIGAPRDFSLRPWMRGAFETM